MWFERVVELGHKTALCGFLLSVIAFAGSLGFEPFCPTSSGFLTGLPTGAQFFALIASGMVLAAFHKAKIWPETKDRALEIQAGVYNFPLVSDSVPLTAAHLIFGLPLIGFIGIAILSCLFLSFALFETLHRCF